MKYKWEHGGPGMDNIVLHKTDKNTGKKFFISYCDGEAQKERQRKIVSNPIVHPETAIVVDDGEYMRILVGDYRKEYEPCETLEECMDVYNKNEDCKR